MFKSCILSLFVISAVYCQDTRPTITLYNNAYEVNATYIFKFHADIPNPDLQPFAEEHRSCWNGAWLGYSGYNYTGGVYGLAAHKNACYSYLFPYWPNRSFRLIGDPANYTTPSLTLFTQSVFNNDDNTVDPLNVRYENDPDLGGKYPSFILNGDQSITFYNGTNFEGPFFCLRPHEWNNVISAIRDVDYDLGRPREMFQSFRFGCHLPN